VAPLPFTQAVANFSCNGQIQIAEPIRKPPQQAVLLRARKQSGPVDNPAKQLRELI
jgi:hypothetical protein